LDWIAQPMTSVATDKWVESWGGHDIHNPAPLWQAQNDTPDPISGFTTRIDINDHSDLTERDWVSPALSDQLTAGPPFTKEAPGYLATEQCIAIRDADFRGKDQYPLEETMQGLNSGGFVQIQHVRTAPHPETVAVNWWRPMSVSIAGQRHENFTLYSRTLSLDSGRSTSSLTGAKSLHWVMHTTRWQQLEITQLIWAERKGPPGGDIHVQRYLFTPTTVEHPFDGTKAEIDIGDPGSMKLSMTGSSQLMSNVQSLKETNLARVLSGNYLSSPDDRDTALILVDPSTTQIRVAVHSSDGSIHKESSIYGLSVGDQDSVLIRSFKDSKDRDAPRVILLARTSSGNSVTHCEFSRIFFNNSAEANRAVSRELSFESPDSKSGPCVLVRNNRKYTSQGMC
jgi:hypothetical protein